MKNILKNKINLLFIPVLFFAAYLRLYRIQDYMTFLGDEGRDVLVAYNILHGHFTLLGPTASIGGFYFGPIYYYMMAPFLFLFNYNPVGPAVMVALFGIATVWLVYKMGSEFFNKPTGLIAAFLYAIAPVIIAYSRSSWNPNPLPFFSILTLYYVYLAVIRKQTTYLILSGLFLGIAVELHFIAVILGIIIAVYILVMKFPWLFLAWYQFLKSRCIALWSFLKSRCIAFYNFLKKIAQTAIGNASTIKKIIVVTIRSWAYIFVGFIIGLLPYLGFEIRHGFPNTISVINFIFPPVTITTAPSAPSNNFFVIPRIVNVFFRLFARLVTNFPSLEQLTIKNPIVVLWAFVTLVLAVTSTFLFLVQIRRTWRSGNFHEMAKLTLVFLWLFFGIALFGFYKRPIYDYYFSFMYPLPFFLVANFIVFLWKKNRLITFCIFVWLVYINLQGIPFRYEPNRQLEQVKKIASFVNEKTEGKRYNFALITGGNSDHAYRYFFTLWHHEPVTILNPIVDPKRKSVTDQLLVVCESIPCQPLGYSVWEVAGFGRADIAGHWNVSVVEIYKLVHYKGNNRK